MFTTIGKILSDPLRVRSAFEAHEKAVAKALEVLEEPQLPGDGSCGCSDSCGAPDPYPCPFRGRDRRRARTG